MHFIRKFLLPIALFSTMTASAGFEIRGMRVQLLNASGIGVGGLQINDSRYLLSEDGLLKVKEERLNALLFSQRDQQQICGTTSAHEAVCWDRSSGEWVQSGSYGPVPKDTVQYEGYCLLTSTGELHCLKAKLERGERKGHYEKVDTSGVDGRVLSISGSLQHVCALTDKGRIYCWGTNQNGRLGIGGNIFIQLPGNDDDWSIVTPTYPTPFPTAAVHGTETVFFNQLSTHVNTTCALSTETKNNLYCWGRLSALPGTETKLAWASQTASSVPRRLVLDTVPEGRLEGVFANYLWGAGWSAENKIYAWGSFEMNPLKTAFELTPQVLGEVPKDRKIHALGMFTSATMCAVTSWEKGNETELEVFCRSAEMGEDSFKKVPIKN